MLVNITYLSEQIHVAISFVRTNSKSSEQILFCSKYRNSTKQINFFSEQTVIRLNIPLFN